MANTLEAKLQNYPLSYFTDEELAIILDGTANSRYSRLKRAVKKGELIRIRRGLYCLEQQPLKTHPFELAQRVYGPSYISLESALSYHGLIPEAVHTITSVSTKRAAEFHTPLGVFSYQALPVRDFFVEVQRIETPNSKYLIAKPWKAICDYVFCYKKNWTGIQPLIDSLRIAEEELPLITLEVTLLLNEYYQSKRVSNFLQSIKRDLKL